MTDLFSQYRTPVYDGGENPLRIPDDDPLLQLLLTLHPDRRYEALQFDKKRNKGEAQ